MKTGREFDVEQEAVIKALDAESDTCPKCGKAIFIVAVENTPTGMPTFTCCNDRCGYQWVRIPIK